MAIPRSREQLAQWCLRSLGHPVVEINLDDDQIEDRIDEAIQFYQEWHSDAVVRKFLKHQLTQDDFDQGYIILPETLISVLRIFNTGTGMAADIFNEKYQMYMSDLNSTSMSGALLDYEMTKQYMSTIEMTLTGTSQQVIFSRHMNRLSIADEWQRRLTVGEYIIIEGYETIDPDEYTDVYNDMMLKKHLTALIKKQWGQNLSKFEGLQLPGGVTLNGRAIYDDAVAEITKIEEEYDLRYAFPPDFFVG